MAIPALIEFLLVVSVSSNAKKKLDDVSLCKEMISHFNE